MNPNEQDSELRETPVSREPIFHGKIIDVERWKVRLPDGGEAPREVVLHRGAAAVVAVDKEWNKRINSATVRKKLTKG